MLVLVLALLMWKPRLSESVVAGPWLEALWCLGEARLWMWRRWGQLTLPGQELSGQPSFLHWLTGPLTLKNSSEFCQEHASFACIGRKTLSCPGTCRLRALVGKGCLGLMAGSPLQLGLFIRSNPLPGWARGPCSLALATLQVFGAVSPEMGGRWTETRKCTGPCLPPAPWLGGGSQGFLI